MDKENKTHSEIILDSIADGVFTVDMNWNIMTFNNAAEKITGIRRQEAIGAKCYEVFSSDMCESGCFLRKTMATRQKILGQNVNIKTRAGKIIPISVNTALLMNPNGTLLGGVETFRDCQETELLKKQIKKSYTFHDIIGKSSKVQVILKVLPDIAKSGSTVLILGPSGSGKEIFARTIHSLSDNHKRPFVAINCGAIPENLLESELFGYIKGAFTDAKADKPGKFRLAQGGTIFLDEIGDLPPMLQVKLLRVIQEKEYEPIGSLKPIKTDARLILATNKDLAQLVREGKFRDDLYYRINVVKLELPSLKDRREDIPLLLSHFIETHNHLTGKKIETVSKDVMHFLMNYTYPGNIRELQNIIEYAFILCQGSVIETAHLPGDVSALLKEPVTRVESSLSSENHKDMFAKMESELIRETLEKNLWSKKRTAQELNMNPSTLWRKMKRHQLLRQLND